MTRGRPTPGVTVVIPTYRRPDMLRRAIASVTVQRYPRTLVAVYDNGGDPATEAVTTEFAGGGAQVRYHAHGRNIGANPNFIYALDRIESEYFVILSDDDFLLPGSLERGMAALAGHPDRWVREVAEAASKGLDEHMKELIALKQVPLFSTLTLEQLASIDRLMVTRHYVKGESVFRRGDVGAELYVIVEGEIRIHLDHAGREVTLAQHGAGNVVGEMSVFDEEPRSASAQATADTTVRVLRRDRLQAIVHEHPEVLLEFVKNLSRRLRAMDQKLEASAPAEPIPTP